MGAQLRVDREEPHDTPHTDRQVGMGVCTLAVSSFVSSLRDRAIGMHPLRLAKEDTMSRLIVAPVAVVVAVCGAVASVGVGMGAEVHGKEQDSFGNQTPTTATCCVSPTPPSSRAAAAAAPTSRRWRPATSLMKQDGSWTLRPVSPRIKLQKREALVGSTRNSSHFSVQPSKWTSNLHPLGGTGVSWRMG